MTGLGSSCGACKFLRRKCTSECIFAPYFCYDQAASHFAAVHKVFGASNVSKLLLHLPVQNRGDAAITIAYEALARMRDPTYGCVAHIFALQQQVANLQEEIENLENHMANLTGFSTGGSLQETITAGNVLEFSPQCEHMNAQYYQNQQAPIFSHAQDATANQDFSSQIAGAPLLLSQQQEQYPSCGFETDLLAELLQGVAPDISGYHPWLDSDSQAYAYI